MEILTNNGTEYLLAASLEQLHHESKDWVKEVDFWKDEMSFFYKLLHSKTPPKSFPGKALASVDEKLVRINADLLDPLTHALRTHEQSLAMMVKTTSLQDEDSYRERHKSLLAQMQDAQHLIRSLKRYVFSFMQTYEQ